MDIRCERIDLTLIIQLIITPNIHLILVKWEEFDEATF